MKNYQPYLENAIIYQINLRTFTNEGTLNAAKKLLPYLKETGIDIVYLCPCFVADDDDKVEGWSERQRMSGFNNPKNPYRIRDYYNVDEEYGTNHDLKNYISYAHSLGIRVILDIVFFHCGSNAVFLEEHPDFIRRKADGTPDTGEWNFPILNYENQALREYLIQNMEMYVRDFEVDGFRCDVGDQVPLDFWKQARERVEKINSSIMLLNEGHNVDYLEVCDISYTWFYANELENLLSGEQPEKAIDSIIYEFKERANKGLNEFCLFIEQHDIVNNAYDNRFEKRIGKEGMDACLVAAMSLPYVPFLYAGEEIADTHRHSIFSNRFHGANITIDWQNALTEAGQSRWGLIKELCDLRHRISAFGLSGKVEFFESVYPNFLMFTREKNGEKYAILVNFSTEDREVQLPSLFGGINEIVLCKNAKVCFKNKRINISEWGYAILKL